LEKGKNLGRERGFDAGGVSLQGSTVSPVEVLVSLEERPVLGGRGLSGRGTRGLLTRDRPEVEKWELSLSHGGQNKIRKSVQAMKKRSKGASGQDRREKRKSLES